jgi:hypothetical protein
MGNIKPLFDDGIFDLNDQQTFTNHLEELENKFIPQGNPFPVEAFPKTVQYIVNETNKCLKFPVDFIGCSLLFASSLAIGNTFKAEIIKNWTEGATLYLALVGKAGTNKSHPLTFALQPIFEHDIRTYTDYKSAKADYDRATTQARSDRGEIPKKPFWKKFIVSDYTPESLADVHRHNMRGVGVYSDELAGWFKNFNRYNKGSETEFWLSNFSGKQISIDRKSNEPILITTPFIGVAGTIQNRILTELGKDDRNKNGFIDRILFSIPENLKKEYWSENSLNSDVTQSWSQIINNLLSLALNYDDHGNPKPMIIGFSSEAKQIMIQWQKENTDLCNLPENEPFASIFSKIEIYVIRLALIMELLYWASGESKIDVISAKTVKTAIALIEYFKNNAIYVNKYISNNNNPTDKLSVEKIALYQALPKEFTTDEGKETASKLNIPERTFERFLTEKEYFIKLKFGKYEKLY